MMKVKQKKNFYLKIFCPDIKDQKKKRPLMCVRCAFFFQSETNLVLIKQVKTTLQTSDVKRY